MLVVVLASATVLHVLVAVRLAVRTGGGGGEGAIGGGGSLALMFVALSLVSFGLASAALLARRSLETMERGGLAVLLVLACMWLFLASAAALGMQLPAG